MVSKADFDSYKKRNIASIKELLARTGTRPVLFVGCGLTRRYLGAPNWKDLLHAIAKRIGMTDDAFTFLSQKADNNPCTIGSLLVDPTHEWAWTGGKNSFPKSYFTQDTEKSVFLKHLAADHLKAFGPLLPKPGDPAPAKSVHDAEIELLRKVAPHAIITTNFDDVLDELFPNFELVVGEQVIPMSMSIIGELYKIHGSTNDPATMVLTQADYDRFTKKRRYISAKMMTYFAEYPVFIIGYGLNDPNVNAIIADLGEAMKEKGGLLSNVYYIEWVPDMSTQVTLKEEHVVPADSGSPPLRVNAIVTSEFDWIFSTLVDAASPISLNVKTLRALAAKVVDIVRADVPKNTIDLDYKKIEMLSESTEDLAKVLGIGAVSNPNLTHPFTITQVAAELGFSHWVAVNRLISEACKRLGRNIKESDNEYHITVKSGAKSSTQKYSPALVAMLKEIRDEAASKK